MHATEPKCSMSAIVSCWNLATVLQDLKSNELGDWECFGSLFFESFEDAADEW